ncbi:ketoacyl-ACP synthase III [Nakamurella flavida]|uniref:Beta-ketoacyl-[acyl-carrier-protein] synthase III n=1 Tax=Nakamurella flavida TaxID=363630 RepID=A0A938YK41_9ACTN|nr:beta-ketoacyl-ACP synthase III [Nakamurella flavida]MBM9474897.1 ketoacyl-ACP synthase III [Nakamurella flavida]MDP9776466.1 3-oxoacyl-[acyl-carrier-protein] synthase-3 [Nakamurella flavida]
MTRIQLPPVVAGSRISGLGSFRPERVVDNHELARIMDTNDEWIRSRVGIQERRFAGPEDTVVSMGAAASAKALAEAGLQPSDVDTVIVATCTLESQIPHAATQVAGLLGIHAPGSFDINAACAGFCYGLAAADQAVRTGNSRTVLVVGSEKLTSWTDPTDRATAIIFADGAGAAVVTATDDPGVGPVVWGSDETQSDAIRVADRNGSLFQEGQAVFRWATTAIGPVAVRAAEAAGVSLADIDVLVPHQANLRIVEAVAKKVIAAGGRPDLVVARDIVTSGNTSSASIPLALDRMRAAGEVASGALVLAVGFGAGLTYAAQVFRCP